MASSVLKLFAVSLVAALSAAACTAKTTDDGDDANEAATAGDVGLGEWEVRHGARGGSPMYTLEVYAKLPSAWGMKPAPTVGSAAFNTEIFRRYGLFPADFDNGGLPLGVLVASEPLSGKPALVTSCEFCHSLSLFGKTQVGTPNPFSNMDRFFKDLAIAAGETASYPSLFNPGTNSVVNAADKFGRWGLGLRNPTSATTTTLTPGISAIEAAKYKLSPATYLKDELAQIPFLKTGAWFNYGIKQSGAAGFYADGGEGKSANFPAFMYMLTFKGTLDGTDLRDGLKNWRERAPAYLKTLKPPKYPFAVNAAAAKRGLDEYDKGCATCHGKAFPAADGSMTTQYPGIIVGVNEVGTDPVRAQLPASFVNAIQSVLREKYASTYDKSHAGGYVAQPLTGIWARSPYLHNGAIPTLRQLLDSRTRTNGYALVANPNNRSDFNQSDVGWRVVERANAPTDEFVRVFDPSAAPGLGNQGHTYGDSLSDAERTDLIEFLKTL